MSEPLTKSLDGIHNSECDFSSVKPGKAVMNCHEDLQDTHSLRSTSTSGLDLHEAHYLRRDVENDTSLNNGKRGLAREVAMREYRDHLSTNAANEVPASSFINDKSLSARQKVVRELYATERSYLNNLKTLVKVYVSPLRLDARSITPMLNLDEVHALFSDVEAVLRISEKVYGDMTIYMERGKLDEHIGSMFSSLAPLFKLYTSYVNSHHRALETHRMLLERPAFKAFCLRCETLPECASCSLDSYLILPVQRVPRYELLLKELLRQTDATHPEHAGIVSALGKISSVAKSINDNLRDHERRNAVLAVQAKFGNSISLVSPQRWFIREAVLRKVCKRKTKLSLFVLFNDILIYGSQIPIPNLNVNRTGNPRRKEFYRYHRTIDLSLAEASACESSTTGEPQLQVLSPTKSFKIIASSVKERDQWVEEICENIAERQRVSQIRAGAKLVFIGSASSDGRNSSVSDFDYLVQPGTKELNTSRHVEHAPVRSSGADVSSCTLCLIEFTYLRRRYQCRRCGIIVCDKCSPHRWRLQNLKQSKLKRVCQKCFSQLTESAFSSVSASDTGDLDERLGTELRRRESMPTMISTFCGSSSLNLSKASISGGPGHIRSESHPDGSNYSDSQSSDRLNRGYGSLRGAHELASRPLSVQFITGGVSHLDDYSTDDNRSSLSSEASFSSASTAGYPFDLASPLTVSSLPSDWREARDADGEAYFWNIHTKEVSWDRPEALSVPPPLPPKPPIVRRHASECALLIPTRESSIAGRSHSLSIKHSSTSMIDFCSLRSTTSHADIIVSSTGFTATAKAPGKSQNALDSSSLPQSVRKLQNCGETLTTVTKGALEVRSSVSSIKVPPQLPPRLPNRRKSIQQDRPFRPEIENSSCAQLEREEASDFDSAADHQRSFDNNTPLTKTKDLLRSFSSAHLLPCSSFPCHGSEGSLDIPPPLAPRPRLLRGLSSSEIV